MTADVVGHPRIRLFLPTDLDLADASETVRRAARVLDLRDDPRSVVFGVRDHARPARTRLELARALIDLARPRGARVVVHDRLDLVLAAEADGVQLGERSVGVAEARALLGRDALVSRSCHDAPGLLAALENGADAATLSPVFASPGKGAPLGATAFAELRARVPALQVVALGGMDSTNVHVAFAAGATGVSALRAWLCDDVDAFVRAVDRSIGDADQAP